MKFFKTKRWLNSKSFWGSLLFAIALWLYTSLNAEYQTMVELPLTVKLPDNRALEQELPSSILINAKGSGWSLFNLIFFNSSKTCFIDLSKERIPDSLYRIERNDMQKGLQYLKNLGSNDVLTETFYLKTGRIGEYKAKISPRVEVQTRDGFTVVGEIKTDPEFVNIRGNEKIAKKIKEWFSEAAVYKNVNSSFTTYIQVRDSLKGVVEVFPKQIKISVEVQQEGEITIPDVPVYVTGGNLPSGHRISPILVSLTLRGGVEALAKISKYDVSALLNYEDLLFDQRGILKPIIKIPENVKLIRTVPSLIYHYVKYER